jgi:hypothetical protein
MDVSSLAVKADLKINEHKHGGLDITERKEGCSQIHVDLAEKKD